MMNEHIIMQTWLPTKHNSTGKRLYLWYDCARKPPTVLSPDGLPGTNIPFHSIERCRSSSLSYS
jgi:hypothetical protein